MPKQKQNSHVPVLLQEVMDTLKPKKGETYLDLTAGYGGHASEIIDITKSSSTLVDRDINAVKVLRKKFVNKTISVMQNDFCSASTELVEQGKTFDIILADLGLSSPHLDNASRGFSIKQDGPLDMRMDESQQLTAEEIVNTYSVEDLTHIIKEYGEDPKARRIAKLIVENRPLKSTTQLAQVVSKAWPGYSRVHPATRTFQAIRIAVNDELGQLKRSLGLWLKLLKPGGRLAVISFHSLEDAVVKQFFKEHGGDTYDSELRILTKRPLSADSNELVFNPRARSARLRVAAKK